MPTSDLIKCWSHHQACTFNIDARSCCPTLLMLSGCDHPSSAAPWRSFPIAWHCCSDIAVILSVRRRQTAALPARAAIKSSFRHEVLPLPEAGAFISLSSIPTPAAPPLPPLLCFSCKAGHPFNSHECLIENDREQHEAVDPWLRLMEKLRNNLLSYRTLLMVFHFKMQPSPDCFFPKVSLCVDMTQEWFQCGWSLSSSTPECESLQPEDEGMTRGYLCVCSWDSSHQNTR